MEAGGAPEEYSCVGEQLGEGEFEVEDIVKVREANGGYQALIKWKGYEKHESTWEAIVDIRSGYFRDLAEQMVEEHRERARRTRFIETRCAVCACTPLFQWSRAQLQPKPQYGLKGAEGTGNFVEAVAAEATAAALDAAAHEAKSAAAAAAAAVAAELRRVEAAVAELCHRRDAAELQSLLYTRKALATSLPPSQPAAAATVAEASAEKVTFPSLKRQRSEGVIVIAAHEGASSTCNSSSDARPAVARIRPVASTAVSMKHEKQGHGLEEQLSPFPPQSNALTECDERDSSSQATTHNSNISRRKRRGETKLQGGRVLQEDGNDEFKRENVSSEGCNGSSMAAASEPGEAALAGDYEESHGHSGANTSTSAAGAAREGDSAGLAVKAEPEEAKKKRQRLLNSVMPDAHNVMAPRGSALAAADPQSAVTAAADVGDNPAAAADLEIATGFAGTTDFIKEFQKVTEMYEELMKEVTSKALCIDDGQQQQLQPHEAQEKQTRKRPQQHQCRELQGSQQQHQQSVAEQEQTHQQEQQNLQNPQQGGSLVKEERREYGQPQYQCKQQQSKEHGVQQQQKGAQWSQGRQATDSCRGKYNGSANTQQRQQKDLGLPTQQLEGGEGKEGPKKDVTRPPVTVSRAPTPDEDRAACCKETGEQQKRHQQSQHQLHKDQCNQRQQELGQETPEDWNFKRSLTDDRQTTASKPPKVADFDSFRLPGPASEQSQQQQQPSQLKLRDEKQLQHDAHRYPSRDRKYPRDQHQKWKELKSEQRRPPVERDSRNYQQDRRVDWPLLENSRAQQLHYWEHMHHHKQETFPPLWRQQRQHSDSSRIPHADQWSPVQEDQRTQHGLGPSLQPLWQEQQQQQQQQREDVMPSYAQNRDSDYRPHQQHRPHHRPSPQEHRPEYQQEQAHIVEGNSPASRDAEERRRAQQPRQLHPSQRESQKQEQQRPISEQALSSVGKGRQNERQLQHQGGLCSPDRAVRWDSSPNGQPQQHHQMLLCSSDRPTDWHKGANDQQQQNFQQEERPLPAQTNTVDGVVARDGSPSDHHERQQTLERPCGASAINPTESGSHHRQEGDTQRFVPKQLHKPEKRQQIQQQDPPVCSRINRPWSGDAPHSLHCHRPLRRRSSSPNSMYVYQLGVEDDSRMPRRIVLEERYKALEKSEFFPTNIWRRAARLRSRLPSWTLERPTWGLSREPPQHSRVAIRTRRRSFDDEVRREGSSPQPSTFREASWHLLDDKRPFCGSSGIRSSRGQGDPWVYRSERRERDRCIRYEVANQGHISALSPAAPSIESSYPPAANNSDSIGGAQCCCVLKGNGRPSEAKKKCPADREEHDVPVIRRGLDGKQPSGEKRAVLEETSELQVDLDGSIIRQVRQRRSQLGSVVSSSKAADSCPQQTCPNVLNQQCQQVTQRQQRLQRQQGYAQENEPQQRSAHGSNKEGLRAPQHSEQSDPSAKPVEKSVAELSPAFVAKHPPPCTEKSFSMRNNLLQIAEYVCLFGPRCR